MPKYPIKFPNDTIFWETKYNCSNCKIIDQTYYNIFNNELDILDKKIQAQLQFLDKMYLVNGYQLLIVYEKQYNDKIFDNIKTLKTYKSNSKAFMNEVYRQYKPEYFSNKVPGDPYKPILLHGRWCQKCGSRKPSIYDTEREIDNDKSNRTFI